MERITANESNQMPSHRLYLICGFLLLASAINYMDRQTLANVGKRVTDEFQLTEQQYGALETSFGLSFAAGSFILGILADRINIRFLYPLILFLWSTVGFLTGFTHSYYELLLCRGLLGFFEAGHWPCGLKAIQLLLTPSKRTMGNSVLQSGTSIGAIITPIIMLSTLTNQIESWRIGFQVVGAIGFIWLIAWFFIIRKSDFQIKDPANSKTANPIQTIWLDLLSRKMIVIICIISIINVTWQILRGWLPKVMLQEHEYTEKMTSYFTSAWYVMTDIGCLGSGAFALWLTNRGKSIKSSRLIAFAICTVLCASLFMLPWIQNRSVLLFLFLISGAGALGLFPIYYSFSQDISRHHQGKVAGFTGVIAWSLSSPTAMLFGWLADRTHTFSIGLAIAGVLPLIALAILYALWPNDET